MSMKLSKRTIRDYYGGTQVIFGCEKNKNNLIDPEPTSEKHDNFSDLRGILINYSQLYLVILLYYSIIALISFYPQ